MCERNFSPTCPCIFWSVSLALFGGRRLCSDILLFPFALYVYVTQAYTVHILIHLSTNTQYPEESLLRTKFLPLLQKHIENMAPAKVVPEREREILCVVSECYLSPTTAYQLHMVYTINVKYEACTIKFCIKFQFHICVC